jgi:hypothetical protein
MFENIPADIICAQFNATLGHGRELTTPKETAMQVKFRLHTDYDREDGYRNLTILLGHRENHVHYECVANHSQGHL